MSNVLFMIMPIAGAMLLAMGIFQVVMDLRTSKQKRIIDRLNEYKAKSKGDQIRESLLRKRAGDQEQNPLEALVSRLKLVGRLQTALDQADVDWSASKMLINITGIALVSGVAILLLGFSPVAALATSVTAFGAPLLWLLRKRKKRLKVIVEQLPDVFELMGQALRAGHGMASAIQLISQQMPDPIAGEFGRVFHEQNLGMTVDEAMLNMANRLDQMDVRFFVTAVLIQRQTGGDLAEILDKIGKVIRDRIELFGVVRALTAEGRLSGWVLLGLPVFCFCAMFFINPDYAHQLTDTNNGRMMLGTAIAMDLMGMAMIKKIVNIKV
jgi:tight adherence protein B